jgi:hypothetical protein
MLRQFVTAAAVRRLATALSCRSPDTAQTMADRSVLAPAPPRGPRGLPSMR